MTLAHIGPGGPLVGELQVPSDKSISHRALLFNALATGRARIDDLLDSADVRSTAACLRALGVSIHTDADRVTWVEGGALSPPAETLDCGNSGTTIRLLMGALAGIPGLHATLTGDSSLRRRPMSRVVDPLRQMGASVGGAENGRLCPLHVTGGPLRPHAFDLPIASAQVRTALVLAGLSVKGVVSVRQPAPSRDHTERILAAMGADLSLDRLDDGSVRTTLRGPARLTCMDIRVPGDFSSAAFLLVAASIVPGSDLTLRGVGVNPTRTGALQVLRRMGADITLIQERDVAGEPCADLRVRYSPLRGTTVGGAEVPLLIDEIPVLAVAAMAASGTTRFRDAHELRVKESDRIQTTVAILRAVGGVVTEQPDGLTVQGGAPLHAGSVDAAQDHRIAMSAMVAGLVTPGGVQVRGADVVDVSFPGFHSALHALRADRSDG